MAGNRSAAVRAAVGFGLQPERLRPLGGRSGSAWSDGDVVLRVGERIADEVLAASAAAGHLPVPRVLDRLELDEVCAVLLERIPGRPAGELALEARSALQPPAGRVASYTPLWRQSTARRACGTHRERTAASGVSCTSTCIRSTSWSTSTAIRPE